MNVIFGASGHAREIAYILSASGFKIDFFVAQQPAIDALKNIPVISESVFLQQFSKTSNINFYVAIGNPSLRIMVVEKIERLFPDAFFPNLFHPSLHIDQPTSTLRLGVGNLFFPGVVLTTDIVIGNHNHFNVHSSISHDCQIGNFNTFSPGSRLAGGVIIGDGNIIGMNAIIIEQKKIENNIIVGAMAAVVKDLVEPGIYIGLPAKKK
jgi:sugar O-acyltransferase (sialic acid O-acetyltransferase NeuD family)